MADGASFWFADAKDDETIIWKVNPQTNEKSILFRFAVANTSADFVVEGKRFAVNPVTGNVTPSLSEKTDDKHRPEMYLSQSDAGWPDLYELELLVAVLRAPVLAGRSGHSAKVGSRFAPWLSWKEGSVI